MMFSVGVINKSIDVDFSTRSGLILGVCCLVVSPNWYLNVSKVCIIKIDGSWHLSGDLVWESFNDSVCFVNFSSSLFLFIILVTMVVEIVRDIIIVT